MASINVDPNAWVNFILRWTFAGLWGAIGWAVANALVIPHIPFI